MLFRLLVKGIFLNELAKRRIRQSIISVGHVTHKYLRAIFQYRCLTQVPFRCRRMAQTKKVPRLVNRRHDDILRRHQLYLNIGPLNVLPYNDRALLAGPHHACKQTGESHNILVVDAMDEHDIQRIAETVFGPARQFAYKIIIRILASHPRFIGRILVPKRRMFMGIAHIKRIDFNAIVLFTEHFQHVTGQLFNTLAVPSFFHGSHDNQVNRKMVAIGPHPGKTDVIHITFVILTIDAQRSKPYRHFIFFAIELIDITIIDNGWRQSTHFRKSDTPRFPLDFKRTEKLQFRSGQRWIDIKRERVRGLWMDDQHYTARQIRCGGIIFRHIVRVNFMDNRTVRIRRKCRIPIRSNNFGARRKKKSPQKATQTTDSHQIFTNIFHKTPVQELLKSVYKYRDPLKIQKIH